MKKFILFAMVFALVFSLTSCNLKKGKIEISDVESSTVSDDDNESSEQKVVIENVFRNDLNNAYDVNSLSVKPKYVYWQDGCLVAECFVINGFSHTVYNINIESLTFSNDSGLIASGEFGGLDGLVIAPYSHVVWTFTFNADCISNYGSDLSRLITNASTSNSY